MTRMTSPVSSEDLDALMSCLAQPERVLTHPQVVTRLSHDFYWYSPVLTKLLKDKRADAVVQTVDVEEVVRILACCFERHLPVTARGAGTGNYGQAIPLEGGIILDLSRMDAIHEITAQGVAIAEPGVRLAALENAAREVGWELCCYPSTVAKASLGGFLSGGSGGIGSVAHGGLRDFQTVQAVEIVTMEQTPRRLLREGEDIHEVLHAWGTNGIITKVWLKLTPKIEWSQCVVAFDSFEEAFSFSTHVAVDDKWTKRLVSTFEWPIPAYFSPIKQLTRDTKSLVFLLIASSHLESLIDAARVAHGEITFSGEYSGLRTQPLLSDYSWNHTTLWAIKYDKALTYLQCGFSGRTAWEQFSLLKKQFGEDILFHLEFMKTGDGFVIPGSIPIVRYTTEERLNEMISFCRSIGVSVANPHNNSVEGGGRYRPDNIQLLAKEMYDPRGLLNPGKMAAFRERKEELIGRVQL